MAQKEDRRIGTIIGGKWRVDHLLGTGSMASVYAVTHRNGVKAALKILHPQLCTDPTVCERFLGEGHLTNAVKHKGIVRVLDDGMTDDGCVFLVMDLLEGKTLETVRQDRGGKLELEETLDIAEQLMDTLHAVHQAGIIHRDLKPQNVFICNDGEVKLLDFGVARILESSKSATKMSLFGMVLGTPSFMSPEQAIGARHEVDQRTDVYSLGATIFTALTGETVHLGPHVQAKLLAAGTTQARSIAVVKQDLPPAIAAVIDTALRFDKADRWQSVDAFHRALSDARRVSESASLAPTSASVPPLKRRSAYPKARLPNDSTAPKPVDKGRTKTLAGVGGPDATFPPPAKTTLPYGIDAREVLDHIASKPADATAPPKEPSVIVQDDGPKSTTEESYPAVHTPVPLNDAYLMSQLTAKRSGAGTFWLTSIGLVALAVGAVAFFASSGGDRSAPSAAAATAPQSVVAEEAVDAGEPAPASTGIVIGDPIVTDAPDAAAAPPKPRAAMTPPTTWRPHRSAQPPSQTASTLDNSTSFPRTSVTPEPPPAPTPAPAPTPTLAPDPFGTPE